MIDNASMRRNSNINAQIYIQDLLQNSLFHLDCLKALAKLKLPQAYIAAGFVRNFVWDDLHGYETRTPLNDIDVIYFDPDHLDAGFEKDCEAQLRSIAPDLPWSVKNQARMHTKNHDAPYTDIETALCHWCETVTPVGARLNEDDKVDLIAPLGLDDLVGLSCHATPLTVSRPHKLKQYRSRMNEKKWWEIWPKVKVMDL